MTIYGLIKNDRDEVMRAFVYDGQRMEYGESYLELAKREDPFTQEAFEMPWNDIADTVYTDYNDYYHISSVEVMEKQVERDNYHIQIVRVDYDENEIETANKYLKRKYPVTYEFTNTAYNIEECMPDDLILDGKKLSEIFSRLYHFTNPDLYILGIADLFLDSITDRMALELEMRLNMNYEEDNLEGLMENIDYIENCYKTNWSDPEFERLETSMALNIYHYMSDGVIEELYEKYEPKNTKAKRVGLFEPNKKLEKY